MWQRSNSPVWLYVCTVLLAAARADNNCPYKECMCGGTYIECQNLGLTSMPIYDSSGVGGSMYLTLTLDSNQITEIPAGSLPPGLTELSLLDNPIAVIDDYAFVDVTTSLEFLYMMNARLNKIPNSFLELNGLEHFNLIDSTVVDWNPGAMAHLGETIQTLNLENVGLSAWPEWLQFYSQITLLSLDNNYIDDMPDNGLEKANKTLLSLTISNNKLTSTPKALAGLVNLQTLDLQGNQIRNVTWLPSFGKLAVLYLNNNSISDAGQLSQTLRMCADSLQSLSLQYNNLDVIPDLSFLTTIRDIDLSRNRIIDPHFGSVNGTIYTLSLDFNLLYRIPSVYMTLPICSGISVSHNLIRQLQGAELPLTTTDLNLDHNLLTELTDSSFPFNSSLEGLTLSNNPLVTISELAFQNLTSLYSINMEGTKLTRIPLALLHLSKLSFLEMGDCPKLICTCQEKSLVSKIMSTAEVTGQCGVVSIATFFNTFGRACP